MGSPLLSASDSGNKSIIKGISNIGEKLCQTCDMVLKIDRDFKLFIELPSINLLMLGHHQLQNAATATCAALCLRHQGWKISDVAIRTGLEHTYLPGRSQFLTSKQAEALGLPGTTILLDGAHTKDSAKALADTIQMTFPKARLVLVVAMAHDKDHIAFARELLSVRQLEAVILTEVNIAGDISRSTPPSLLKARWIQASREVDVDILDFELLKKQSVCSTEELVNKTILLCESSLTDSMSVANQILRTREGDHLDIVVVTGSLHIVSTVLGSLEG